MKRGEVWTLAGAGDYLGKPRPVVIVQHDAFAETHSVVVCALTTSVIDAPIYRITIEPSAQNGLRDPCSIMIEKVAGVLRSKVGRRIGRLEPRYMAELDKALLTLLGLVGGNDDRQA